MLGLSRRRAALAEPVIDISEKDGIRTLHLGEDDTQSAMRIKNPNELVLAYSRAMLASLLFQPEPQDAVLIGLGGGSIAKWLHQALPALRLDCVELLPQVVAVARSMFHLPANDATLNVIVGDGAAYIHEGSEPLDWILMDAYSAAGIAPALATREFFAACRSRLRRDGVLSVNLWGSDKRFDHYVEQLSEAFDGQLLLLPARQRGNVVAMAFARDQGSPTWERLCALGGELRSRYGIEFDDFVTDLARMNPSTEHRLLI